MEAWHPWAAAAAFASAFALRLWLRDAWQRLRLASRRRRAAEGEREAELLLRRRGYHVRGRQVERRLTYRRDDEPVVVTVRADLLVERRGRRFVAEVKTGDVAPRLASRDTRRQLLEYAHAFDVDGLLLVDADRGAVHRVGLPVAPRPPAWRLALWTLLLGLAVGAVGARYAMP